MNKPELEQIREKLENELNEWQILRDYIQQNGLDEGAKDSISELSVIDNHPADVGTETLNRAQDLAYKANLDRSINRYELALAKLNAGTYGLCDECGRPIGMERLQAKPEAALCIDCQKQLESAGSNRINTRPREEDALGVPFARTFLDDADQTGFDGEDSWQAVAQYGSSDTPSDVPGADHYPNIFEDADEPRGIVEEVEGVSSSILEENKENEAEEES